MSICALTDSSTKIIILTVVNVNLCINLIKHQILHNLLHAELALTAEE